MANELILIRHGNAVRIKGDYVHAPLTELGQKQATLTGRYMCGRYDHLDAFYCSPLRRARETAARIGSQLGQVPHVQNGVQELELIEVPQLVIFEALARLGVFDHYLYNCSGTQILWPILGRISRALCDLMTKHPEQRIVVVAHSGVISGVLAWYYPRRRRRWWRYTVDNCSLTALNVEDRTAELLFVNDTNHLRPEETTAQPPAPSVELANAVERKLAPPVIKPVAPS